jgi:hypothetical protein
MHLCTRVTWSFHRLWGGVCTPDILMVIPVNGTNTSTMDMCGWYLGMSQTYVAV